MRQNLFVWFATGSSSYYIDEGGFVLFAGHHMAHSVAAVTLLIRRGGHSTTTRYTQYGTTACYCVGPLLPYAENGTT